MYLKVIDTTYYHGLVLIDGKKQRLRLTVGDAKRLLTVWGELEAFVNGNINVGYSSKYVFIKYGEGSTNFYLSEWLYLSRFVANWMLGKKQDVENFANQTSEISKAMGKRFDDAGLFK